MANNPLAILDLVPIPTGATAADALNNSIDLAQHAERCSTAGLFLLDWELKFSEALDSSLCRTRAQILATTQGQP